MTLVELLRQAVPCPFNEDTFKRQVRTKLEDYFDGHNLTYDDLSQIAGNFIRNRGVARSVLNEVYIAYCLKSVDNHKSDLRAELFEEPDNHDSFELYVANLGLERLGQDLVVVKYRAGIIESEYVKITPSRKSNLLELTFSEFRSRLNHSVSLVRSQITMLPYLIVSRIQDCRQEKGYTQEDMAQFLAPFWDVSVSRARVCISHIETGYWAKYRSEFNNAAREKHDQRISDYFSALGINQRDLRISALLMAYDICFQFRKTDVWQYGEKA